MHRPSGRQWNAKVVHGFVADRPFSQRTLFCDGNKTSRVRLLRLYQTAHGFRYRNLLNKKVFCSCQEQRVFKLRKYYLFY